MFRNILFLAAFLLVLVANAQVEPVISITKKQETIDIVPQISILKDTSGKLLINEVASKPLENKFILNTGNISNFGSSLLPIWCRFSIKNYTDESLVLEIDNSQIEWLDLFNLNNNDYTHKSISAYRPFSQKEVLLNKCFFLLDIPKDSTLTYYLRLQTQNGLQFPLILLTEASLAENEQTNGILFGIYIGIMVIMILYNLMIYITIRDRPYLFYILYVSFMCLTNVTDKGLAFEFLWPSHPELNHFVTIIGCLTGIFAILFAMSFLQISKYSPILKSIFYGIIFCYFISITVILFKERFVGLILSEALTIAAAITLLIAGIVVYKRGYKPAVYYLVAWSVLLICVLIFLLADLNILPKNDFTLNGLTIGSSIETFLLSLALANRINVYKKEKEQMRVYHEKELLELEARALRAQMNPHFIFNCMNSIKALIQQKEEDKAISYLTTFSKLIRTIFQNSDKREISLFDEIETCMLYTQLESMRFENKFSYSFFVDESLDMKSVMIPALIIQPFIENAIWHGIMPGKRQGVLHVTLKKENEVVRCVIDDDGIGREMSMQNKVNVNSTTHQSKGVHLTQRRFDLHNILNHRNASFNIIDKKNNEGNVEGTTVVLEFHLC